MLIRGRTGLEQGLATNPEDADVAMYARIVQRIHGGEGYYQAAGAELRSGGRALRPFFNWRLPTLACLMARLPDANAGRLVLAGLALVGLLLWAKILQGIRPAWLQAVGAVLLLFPFGLTAVAPFHMFHESWAGVCIAVALAARARGYWQASVVAGLLALSLRELALPFVAVMLVGAWWQRHRPEAACWLVGLVAFVVLLGGHAWIVSGHVTQADPAHEGWWHLPDWAFVVRTARANPILQMAPSWVAGVVLPLALVGLAAWSGPVGTRVAAVVGVYVASFVIVGRSVNDYWGLMYAPLLPLGLIFAPQALATLARAGWTPRPAPGIARPLRGLPTEKRGPAWKGIPAWPWLAMHARPVSPAMHSYRVVLLTTWRQVR